MQLKKFTRKDRHGNMMSFEFDIPQANVPAMQSIPMYDHPGDPKGTDTVPAWLTPGEFVVNKEATEMFGPTIKKINDVGRQKQDQNKAMYAQEGAKVLSRSLLDQDEDFQTQLNQMLDKYEGSEFNKDKLYNMIDGESSFDPTVKNENSSARGLFQFTDTAINDLIEQGRLPEGFDINTIQSMDPTSQLKLYENYLDRWKYGGDAHLGIMQAAPGAYFEKFKRGDNKGNLNQEVFAEGSKSYEDNPVWAGDDGKMTFASISKYYDSKAKKKTADKIPGVDVAQIKPQDIPSGAQVVSEVPSSNIPNDTALNIQTGPGTPFFARSKGLDPKYNPTNLSIPNYAANVPMGTNAPPMAAMEPIPGPSSGRIAEVMGNQRPSKEYADYMKSLELKADDYFNNDGVIPRQNVTLDTRQIPGVNPMLDINQPAGVPIPTRVVGGKRVALTPEYLDAMQDNDMGGLGADSQVFKDFVGSRLRVPVNQAPPNQVLPTAADIVEPKPYDAASMLATNQGTQFPGVPDMGIYVPGKTQNQLNIEAQKQQELQDTMENFSPAEEGRLVDSLRATLNREDAPQYLSDEELARAEKFGKELQGIDDFARKAGKYIISPKEFRNERGLTGKQEEKAQKDLAKMEKLEPIEKGYDQKQRVATEIEKQNTNQTGPGPDQPGNNADPDTVKNTGSNAPAAEQNKTTSFLKGLFGSLFDTDELKRMGVMYLGSRLMGYSHGGSLSFSVNNYLQRVDAKEQAAVKFATSAGAAKAYTAKSLAKYAKSGDITDLVPLPKQLISTGNATTLYGNKNGKDFKVQVMEYKSGTGDNAPRIFLDKFGNEHNPLDYDLDPIYNKNSPKHRDALDSYTKTFADVMTSVREKTSLLSVDKGKKVYKDDVIPATDAGAVAAWALDNKVELPRMRQLIELAYRDMIEDGGRGYRATSIVGYLDSLKIRETILDGADEDRLFRLPPASENEKARGFGKVVEAKEFERLKQNAIRWMRITQPKVSGVPDQEVSIGAFKELVSKWDTLTDKQKEEWDAKSSKTTTGFMEWSKASINNVIKTMAES